MDLITQVTRRMPRNETTRVVAITHNKGGVGKTTTCNILAHGLALHGFKVLVVELEMSPRFWQINTPGYSDDVADQPRESETVYGYLQHPDYGLTSGYYAVDPGKLLAKIPNLRVDYREQLIRERHWEHPVPFFMLPGHRDLWMLQDELSDARRSTGENIDLRLAHAFRATDISLFDIALVDTPPTRNVFQRNGLKGQYLPGPGAYVIIPVDFDPDASKNDFLLSEDAVNQTITECQQSNIPIPQILGVVYNQYDPETEDEIDAPLYRTYTQIHADPRTGKSTQPLVQYPQLGFLKRHGDIKRALARSQSPLTVVPTKETGVAAYDLVCNVEKGLGIAAYVK